MNIVGAERRSFKKTVTQDDGRRSREQTTINIRKSKKDEQMMKRRGLAPVGVASSVGETASTMTTTTISAHPIVGDNPSVADYGTKEAVQQLMAVLYRYKQNTQSVPPDEIRETVKSLRRLLSKEIDPPVEETLQAGILEFLVEFLTHDSDVALQFEAAWCLTNIASTSRSREVALSGAVPLTVRLLWSSNPHLAEQVAWCLGNIAGDSNELRDGLLNTPGLVDGMIHLLETPKTPSMLQNVSWAVSNLCRGKPRPDFAITSRFIAPLVVNLDRAQTQGAPDSEGVDIETDTVWALCHLTDGENSCIETVMQTGVLDNLMYILQNKWDHRPILIPTVRCLGNMVSGNDTQADRVLQAGLLNYMPSLFENKSGNIRKDAYWICSNIAAGTHQQIEQLFQSLGRANMVDYIVETALDSKWEIRKEALWTISNIFTTGTDMHIKLMVSMGGIQAICNALGATSDATILMMAMEAIDKVMVLSEKCGLNYGELVEQCNGTDRLEEIQSHQNDDVYDKAVLLITNYFGGNDDEMELQNLAPVETNGQFAFGLSAKQLFPDGASSSGEPSPVMKFNFGGINAGNV